MPSALLPAWTLFVVIFFKSLSSQSTEDPGVHFPYVPIMTNALGAVYSAPEGVISVAGLAHIEKMKNITEKMGTNHSMLSAEIQPFQAPGGEKNMSSFPRDVNLDLVDLFSVFFKPNRILDNLAISRPSLYILRDIDQKVVYKVRNLLLASAQTNNEIPARISVVPNPNLDASKFPIIMGVDNGALCISCEMASQPVLKLENRSIMDLYRNGNEAKRFTFTCSFTGDTQRFESVAFPGWYLSTSPSSNRPLQLTNHLGETEITDFYFRKV